MPRPTMTKEHQKSIKTASKEHQKSIKTASKQASQRERPAPRNKSKPWIYCEMIDKPAAGSCAIKAAKLISVS